MAYRQIGSFDTNFVVQRKHDYKRPVTFYDRVRFVGPSSSIEILGGAITSGALEGLTITGDLVMGPNGVIQTDADGQLRWEISGDGIKYFNASDTDLGGLEAYDTGLVRLEATQGVVITAGTNYDITLIPGGSGGIVSLETDDVDLQSSTTTYISKSFGTHLQIRNSTSGNNIELAAHNTSAVTNRIVIDGDGVTRFYSKNGSTIMDIRNGNDGVSIASGKYLYFDGTTGRIYRSGNIVFEANGTYTQLQEPSGGTRFWIANSAMYYNANNHYFRDVDSNIIFRMYDNGNESRLYGRDSDTYMAVQAPEFRLIINNVEHFTFLAQSSSEARLGIREATPDAAVDVDQNSLILQARRASSGATDDMVDLRSNWGASNRQVFLIEADGDVFNYNNSYGALSDERLKSDIADARDYSPELRDIRVTKFRFTEDEDHWLLGPIAQDVEKHAPGLVVTTDIRQYETDEDGEFVRDENGQRISRREERKFVKTSVLYGPMLHSGWKAHDKRIAELEAKVEQLSLDREG